MYKWPTGTKFALVLLHNEAAGGSTCLNDKKGIGPIKTAPVTIR